MAGTGPPSAHAVAVSISPPAQPTIAITRRMVASSGRHLACGPYTYVGGREVPRRASRHRSSRGMDLSPGGARSGVVALLLVACLLLAACGAAEIAGAPARHRTAAAARATGHVRPALAPLLHGRGPRLVAGVRVGHSADGRAITVTASGSPGAAAHVLVVGCIHGTECAGIAVARRVLRGRAGCPPAGADIWSLEDLDPD